MQTAQQKNDLTSLSELTTLPSFYVFSQTGENHTQSTRGPRRRHVFTSLVVFSPVSLYLFRPCSYRRSFSNAPGSPAFHRLPQYLRRHSDCVEPLNNTIRNQSRWENKRHRMTVCPMFSCTGSRTASYFWPERYFTLDLSQKAEKRSERYFNLDSQF